MPEFVFVRPARSPDGSPLLVPRAAKTLIRQSKDGAWPRGAVLAEGESLESTPYIKHLIRTRELVVDEPAALAKTPSRASKTRTEPDKSSVEK